MADWAVASANNQALPFLVIDKIQAVMFLFDGRGSILASTPVLLGLGRGDDSPPGIGDRTLASMTAAERITPAGRFVASRGRNLLGEDILWVDYAAAISLHRATDLKPGLTAKSRMTRLSSTRVADRHISHGCINVSPAFYDRFIASTFATTRGIVYVLPETRSIGAVFPMSQSTQHASLSAAATTYGG